MNNLVVSPYADPPILHHLPLSALPVLGLKPARDPDQMLQFQPSMGTANELLISMHMT
jgi:hypothetical protein